MVRLFRPAGLPFRPFGRRGLRPHAQRADLRREAQMRPIDFPYLLRGLLVCRRKLQIAAQHRAADPGVPQFLPDLSRQILSQQLRRRIHLKPRHRFAHRQLYAAETLRRGKPQPFPQRSRPGIMQPDSDIHACPSSGIRSLFSQFSTCHDSPQWAGGAEEPGPLGCPPPAHEFF